MSIPLLGRPTPGIGVGSATNLLIALLVALPAQAHEGWGIVVDARGWVYFTDIPANTVWRIRADGRQEKIATGLHSHALVLGSNDEIFGTHPDLTARLRSVWRFTDVSGLQHVIGPSTGLPLGLQSFIRDSTGNVFSMEVWNPTSQRQSLLRRKPSGDVSAVAGGALGYADGRGADARFLGVDGIAWTSDGALHVTDGPYLRRVTIDGQVTTLGGGALTTRRWGEDLLGVAVDQNGNSYMADFSGRRILRLSRSGAVRTVLRTGSLWAPTGVAVTDNDLLVLEHLRAPLGILGDLGIGPYIRVRRLMPDGTASTLAQIWGARSVPAALGVLGALTLTGVLGRWHTRSSLPRTAGLRDARTA